MKFFRSFLLTLLLITLATNVLTANGYKITIKANGVSNKDIILAHYFAKAIYPDDTITVNEEGVGVFEGKEELPGGMYIFFLPNKKIVDFLLDEDQQFYFEFDTTTNLDARKIEGSKINERFLDYQLYVKEKRKLQEPISKELEDTTLSKKNRKKLKEELKSINQEVEEHIDELIEKNEDNFFGTFIKAMKRVEIPDPPEDEEGNIDSTWQYKYYRNHYFDNFDITDTRLLHTPLYEGMIMKYLKNVVPPSPDSIIPAVDELIEKSRADDDLFRYMLITLFNYYAKSKIMGMDKVYLHIADKYYIDEATWSDSTFIEKLKKHVNESRGTIIGRKAPNIQMIYVPDQHFKDAANDTGLMNNVYVGSPFYLHDVKANYTILIFWEKDCGHCRKAIPKLNKIYHDTLKDVGVKVISFHMLFGKEGKAKWIKFVNEHDLYGWLNVWNPYSYDFKKKYNVKSTPQLYVLDKDKNIIAKRIGPEQARDIILEMIKREKK